MKMLVVGPSPTKSKGGMATVIEEIKNDNELNRRFDIDIYESYIDGNKLQVLFFSLYAFVKFYFTKRNYVMQLLMVVHSEKDGMYMQPKNGERKYFFTYMVLNI